MARLKNRQLQIPGGMFFYIPDLKWQARKGSSLDSIVRETIAVLRGNPKVAAKLGWDLSVPAMTERVDTFNAQVCLQMGWNDYVLESDGANALPKTVPPSLQLGKLRAAARAAASLVAGAKTLLGWLDSGDPAVDAGQAEARAAVCAVCPHNPAKASLTDWFTVPASEIIRRQIERLDGRRLATSKDADLHVCDVCLCPLRLKVHTPLAWIAKQVPPDTLAKLRAVPGCWVAREMVS